MDLFYPIQLFADIFTYSILGITKNSYLGNAVNFFIYDGIKIGLLLLVINFIMAIVRYFFPIENIRNILLKRRWFGIDYFLAALLGVFTPFCSCSSIPLFIGFLSAGIPLGVTFAFLISSPLVNEASLALFPALFGWKVALLYNVLGITISMIGGYVIDKLNMKRFIRTELLQYTSKNDLQKIYGGKKITIKELLQFWLKDGLKITKEVFPFVILGVGIGAIIHGFVPASMVETYLLLESWWSVPLAVVIGTPLYANSVSVIPIMEALVMKGVPIGTALAFMTAVVTLSIPQLLILKKVMKWQLLATFVGITTIGIMIIGYVFNLIA